MDHQIRERMLKYPLIVIPEWDAFDTEIKDQLLDYVKKGGNILVIGAKATKEFEDHLAVTFQDRDTTTQINIGDRSLGGIAGIKTQWQPVISSAGTEEIGHVYSQCDYRYATDYPVATINNYGKGKIAALYMDMSTAYNTYRNPVFNQLVNRIISRLISDETLKVTGSDNVHVVLGKKSGNGLVHLINTSGAHFNNKILAYNELRPTPSLTVSLKVPEKPKAVKLQPMDKELEYKYLNNRIELLVPPIDVHSIIEVIQ